MLRIRAALCLGFLLLNKPGLWIRIRINFGSRIRIAIRGKSENSGALEAQNGAVEGRGRSQWRPRGSKGSPGGSVDPVVADAHNFEEEQDPDLH